MRPVAIIGIGDTRFGELWEHSLRDIGMQAGISAVSDANIAGEQIEALYIGNMAAGSLIDQEHLGALVADYSGLASLHLPAVRIEAAGASGGMALREGYMAVASGMHDIVMVAGAEKMTDVADDEIPMIQMAGSDQQWEGLTGATMASLYAMIARRHMHEFGTTREQIASVSVKNHRNGAWNPSAQYQKAVDMETVLKSPMVADPLGVFDCAPISDGSAAVILAPLELAKKYTDEPVVISASAAATDTLALHHRASITRFDSVKAASDLAYKRAGIRPKDIDVAEVHDSFTIAEILNIEDLGFFEKGKGGAATLEGMTEINGVVSVNTSGGLKSRGDPMGATGIAQAVEVVRQLRGKAEKRQVSDAEYGLSLNVGGTGATSVVHIYRRG
ncbi:MAG: thiolase domain-containing protein [Thermoplasmata archaeon]|uniref:Thiolase domain-containing protein n=1 Tax=Candidatus Sysuiplasma superficiale TaxID=2823368 RepID=A0A8J7YPF8_9ARCH|nr:thiolase domain-containing protein [Candidatus Sysuiplasma superficiale]MBX8644493.1 thiolase domain-containing protein [Candidatus Sysuiplasma superficiale]